MKEGSPMVSAKARKNADACRFCWMCRHLCPVGLATGREMNTPRAKGLVVSLVERGYEYTAGMAADMYECCLCEACTTDCATGFEPPSYIREARTRAVVEGIAPPAVEKAMDALLEKGNIYGADRETWMGAFRDELRGLPAQAPVALHIGATIAYREPRIAAAAIRLLKKAGVDFCLIGEEAQTGAELGDLMGFVDEVRTVARAAVAQIDATGATTLVVLDPSCARFFIRECGEWGCKPAAEVLTATSYFAGLLKSGRLAPAPAAASVAATPGVSPVGAASAAAVQGVSPAGVASAAATPGVSPAGARPSSAAPPLAPGAVTFHDPCRLARDLDETAPAREILAALGLEFREMYRHGRDTKCCGGVALNAHSPKLTDLTSAERWKDALRTGASTLVTACAGCRDLLKKSTPPGCATEDIFVLLADACGT
jgi:Fe-S oxidoreductase